MPFPTAAFAVFFVAAFTLNWLLRPHELLWRATMVAVSLYFCAWVDVRFALLIVASAVVNGLVATAAARALDFGDPTPASRRWVASAVAFDVVVLGLFAYHGFFLGSVTDVIDALGLSATAPTLGLLVPVGLSIVTLHAIGYVVDVGRGDVEPVAWGDLLLYLSFFPHLVAGPPVRVDELVPQFHERPDPRRVPATDAFVLIGVGLFKAVVVAGYLGSELVDPAFADPGAASGWALAAALYAFAVQIYAGFSGLTDIAVGCALLLGVEYPRPFDAPYTALSVREFWDRWNTPVSHWLRDYVYVPLGGNRRSRGTTYRNVLLTMVTGALWYGAGWPFVVWGALHGAYLVGERAVAARVHGGDGDEAPEVAPGDAGGGGSAVGAHVPARGRGLDLLPRRVRGRRPRGAGPDRDRGPGRRRPRPRPGDRHRGGGDRGPVHAARRHARPAGPLHDAGAGGAGGGAGARPHARVGHGPRRHAPLLLPPVLMHPTIASAR